MSTKTSFIGMQDEFDLSNLFTDSQRALNKDCLQHSNTGLITLYNNRLMTTKACQFVLLNKSLHVCTDRGILVFNNVPVHFIASIIPCVL